MPRLCPEDPGVKKPPKAPGRRSAGRQFVTAAMRELLDRLRPAEERRVGGSVVLLWPKEGPAEGDGIVVARMSSEDRKGLETIGAQIGTTLEYSDRKGLTPSRVVAVLNHSGTTHFDERLDFQYVFEAHRAGQAAWVVYRGLDRVARAMEWTAIFTHFVRTRGIELHLADHGRAFDLDDKNERLQIWVLAMVAEHWHASIVENTWTAHRRKIESGSGHGGSGGFGFTQERPPGGAGFKRVVEVEEEFQIVQILFRAYLETRSVRRTLELMRDEHNVDLSYTNALRMLRNEKYVTGRFKVRLGDETYWGATELSNPCLRRSSRRSRPSSTASAARRTAFRSGLSSFREAVA